MNGLDDESDELPRLAWVAEILKHPVVKPSAMMTIKLDAIRAIVVYLPSMVFSRSRLIGWIGQGSDERDYVVDLLIRKRAAQWRHHRRFAHG